MPQRVRWRRQVPCAGQGTHTLVPAGLVCPAVEPENKDIAGYAVAAVAAAAATAPSRFSLSRCLVALSEAPILDLCSGGKLRPDKDLEIL